MSETSETAPAPRRYPTMVRTVAWGATREELAADLARIEALEREDASWSGVTATAGVKLS